MFLTKSPNKNEGDFFYGKTMSIAERKLTTVSETQQGNLIFAVEEMKQRKLNVLSGTKLDQQLDRFAQDVFSIPLLVQGKPGKEPITIREKNTHQGSWARQLNTLYDNALMVDSILFQGEIQQSFVMEESREYVLNKPNASVNGHL